MQGETAVSVEIAKVFTTHMDNILSDTGGTSN